VAILTIGRVGIEVELNHPSEMTESRSIDSREFVLRGYIRSDSVTLTKYLRNELLEQQGQVVAVTYTLDSHFDAFYLLADSRIESMETSYLRRGLFLFEVSLFRIGASSRVEFQSNLTGTVLENTIGLTEGEVRPFVAPPVNHSVFGWDATFTSVNRVTEDGTIVAYLSTGDFSADADWGCEPSAYYDGSAKIYTSDRLRAGLDIPNAPTAWEINNGLIKVVPDGTATKFIVSVWDGTSAYESAKTWEPLLNAANLSAFSFVNAVRNDPECVILRVTSGGNVARHTIDLQLRRGSPQVFVNWYWGGAAGNMRIQRDSVEAGTSITPTGASSSAGVRATSNDGDGNRYTIFTPTASKVDESYGVYVASANRLNVALGFEIDGTTAIAGNTASDLALQYFGMVGERVRAVWR